MASLPSDQEVRSGLQTWSANQQSPSSIDEHHEEQEPGVVEVEEQGYAGDPSYEEPSASGEEYDGGKAIIPLLIGLLAILTVTLTGVGFLIGFGCCSCCCGKDYNSNSGDILAIAGMTEVGITTASKEFVKALSGAVLYFNSAVFNMPFGQKLTAEAVQAASKAGGFSLFDETATKKSSDPVSDKTLIFSNTEGNPKDVRVLKQLMRLIEKVAPHALDKFGLDFSPEKIYGSPDVFPLTKISGSVAAAKNSFADDFKTVKKGDDIVPADDGFSPFKVLAKAQNNLGTRVNKKGLPKFPSGKFCTKEAIKSVADKVDKLSTFFNTPEVKEGIKMLSAKNPDGLKWLYGTTTDGKLDVTKREFHTKWAKAINVSFEDLETMSDSMDESDLSFWRLMMMGTNKKGSQEQEDCIFRLTEQSKDEAEGCTLYALSRWFCKAATMHWGLQSTGDILSAVNMLNRRTEPEFQLRDIESLAVDIDAILSLKAPNKVPSLLLQDGEFDDMVAWMLLSWYANESGQKQPKVVLQLSNFVNLNAKDKEARMKRNEEAWLLIKERMQKIDPENVEVVEDDGLRNGQSKIKEWTAKFRSANDKSWKDINDNLQAMDDNIKAAKGKGKGGEDKGKGKGKAAKGKGKGNEGSERSLPSSISA